MGRRQRHFQASSGREQRVFAPVPHLTLIAPAAACRPGRAPGEYLMSMRMLIDARHREETRVAVVKGNRIEEFDFESEEHKQLKGNIYLAKVTRVEPSLQAAFIDYGGNTTGA